MKQPALDPKVRNGIEAELENYYDTKKAIERMKRDLIPSPVPNYEPSAGGHSNSVSRSTENITLTLLNNIFLNEACKNIDAIEHVLSRSSRADQKLIELVYFRGTHTVTGAAQCVHMSRTQAYIHTTNILREIGIRMGRIQN